MAAECGCVSELSAVAEGVPVCQFSNVTARKDLIWNTYNWGQELGSKFVMFV